MTSNYGNGQSIVYSYNDDNEITSIKLGTETKYGYEYFETTDENGEVTEEWTELTDYVNNIKKVIEESKTTVNDLNGNFIYSIESVTKDEEDINSFDGTVTTIGSNVYTLVSEENKDTFKTNGTTDFTKEYTYVSGELSGTETAGLTTSYTYNADSLISTLENTLNDISKIYGYTYDEDGNITTETVTTENGNGTVESSETITYTYDDKEQLISAETSSIKYEYTYDDRGNILTKKEYAVTIDENGEKVYTLIEDSTDTYIYDETWKDKLISYNGQSITYDVVGNPTNYMGNTLTWTMGRQLASFGGITYTYNEEGIRTSKTVNGVTTKFYLDGTNIIEQTDGTTTLHFFYDSNDEIIGFKYNGDNYFYIKNSARDIVGVADVFGNLIASYSYDAWGKVISVSGSNIAIGKINPFRYRSYYYDSDIQMYYLQSRYYSPQIKRFINSDDANFISINETEISCNPFVYCDNNPVNYIDYYGYIAISTCVIIGVCIGAVIGGAAGYALAKKGQYSVKDGWAFWKYICGGIVIGGVAGGILGYFGGALFGASGIKAGTLASKISMSKVRALGKMGEKLAKIQKNTQRIESVNKTAKYRVPDILDKANKIIGDVKYVKSLSLTKQIKDYVAYAAKYGYTVVLFVKPETVISGPLQKLVDAGKIALFYITK